MPLTLAEKIERWENVERVLKAMPEHERQHHWNMSTWGEKTQCGTVACAAGHCGLDPWFRERNFTLNFDSRGDATISNVEGFFGIAGSQRIFLNSARRSVEKVITEVQTYLGELRASETLTVGLPVPAIGAEWPEAGGIYAGAVAGEDEESAYLLIVGPAYDGRLTWNQATQWAKDLIVGEHKDFSLPTRAEGKMLFERVQELFGDRWYWLSEQHADYSGYAWCQYFNNGFQDCYGKGTNVRARAVRRFPLRSFSASVISPGEGA